jgi:ribosomal protein S18 acetylase RimI-like enzyme
MSSKSPLGNLTIRPVQEQDVLIVRDLILQMLTDSPEAFGETLAEARSRTETEWKQYVESSITPPQHTAFIASDVNGACGFVAGDAANSKTPPGTVLVNRLWVAPRQRGTGLGRQLMDIITKWANEQNAQQIGLGVTELNISAMKFYEHLGYIDLGVRTPIPWDLSRQIIILGRKL